MSHLTERAILELRDGFMVDADARAHLGECEMCRTALEEAEVCATDIASTLTDLDERFEVDSAHEVVRARLAERETAAGQSREPRVRTSFWTLGRAATFLLVTTGGLSALPGSPLREFISGRGSQSPASSTLAPSVSGEPVGMRMIVEDGPVVVELDQVPTGTSIEVRWVTGPAVTVLGAQGSSFTSAQGRVQATITSGPVTIEFPESISAASLVVNGRIYLQRSAGYESTSVPVVERDANRIRFIVP